MLLGQIDHVKFPVLLPACCRLGVLKGAKHTCKIQTVALKEGERREPPELIWCASQAVHHACRFFYILGLKATL